jgi:hypothetical protein
LDWRTVVTHTAKKGQEAGDGNYPSRRTSLLPSIFKMELNRNQLPRQYVPNVWRG